MAILGVDDFKSKLVGGGARGNLFKVTLNFPAYAEGDVDLSSFMCKASQLPASSVAIIKISCDVPAASENTVPAMGSWLMTGSSQLSIAV